MGVFVDERKAIVADVFDDDECTAVVVGDLNGEVEVVVVADLDGKVEVESVVFDKNGIEVADFLAGVTSVLNSEGVDDEDKARVAVAFEREVDRVWVDFFNDEGVSAVVRSFRGGGRLTGCGEFASDSGSDAGSSRNDC